MRQIISIFLLLLLPFPASLNAKLPEKEMRKIIIDCDVADTVMRADDNGSFWQLLQQTNSEYRKTAKSLSSSGDRDIKRQLISVLSNCDLYFRAVPTRSELYGWSEAVADSSGIRAICPVASLTVTDEKDIAIFSYPNGYAFITDGLYKVMGGDTALLSALFAAENAHYALQHAYAHQKFEKKRRRKQKFWQIFGAVALTGASIAADQITDGGFPAELGMMAAVALASAKTSDRYLMQYTPKQIHEADIVAYRFCQFAYGSGTPYVMALHMAGNDIDVTSGTTADAPTVAERIALLNYMESHPELRGKIKANRSKPKPIKNTFNPFSPANYR